MRLEKFRDKNKIIRHEPPRDKSNNCGCAPSEDLDQPEHPPSLISVFAVHMKKAWVLSYPLSAQRRLWSDWADAQADLNLRWAHSHFVGLVTRRLNYVSSQMLRSTFKAHIWTDTEKQGFGPWMKIERTVTDSEYFTLNRWSQIRTKCTVAITLLFNVLVNSYGHVDQLN